MKKSPQNNDVDITDSRIQKYAQEMTSPESSDLQKVVKSSALELDFVNMLSGNNIAQLLKLLIKISGSKRVLEIGTFTGYSALAMAEALPDDGEVITVEMNILYQEMATAHFDKYDSSRKISLFKGNAIELLDEIEGVFDFVFLDADKISYPFYYEKLLPKIIPGGLLVADNTLWNGTVLDPKDPKAKAIDDFNKLVAEDERVEQLLLPVRDGITIIHKY